MWEPCEGSDPEIHEWYCLPSDVICSEISSTTFLSLVLIREYDVGIMMKGLQEDFNRNGGPEEVRRSWVNL